VMDVDYFAMESMYESNYEPQAPGEIIGPTSALVTRYQCFEQWRLHVYRRSAGGEEFIDSWCCSLQLSAEAAETLTSPACWRPRIRRTRGTCGPRASRYGRYPLHPELIWRHASEEQFGYISAAAALTAVSAAY
jgi:hypothetical protein